MLLNPFHLALGVLEFERFALVVLLFTLSETDFELSETFLVDKKSQRYDCQTTLLNLALQLVELLTFEEELALALGGMIIESPVEILSDAHTLDPQLVIIEIAERIGKGGVTATYGLYLCSVQLDSSDETLDNLVVERRPFILYIDFFLCHC